MEFRHAHIRFAWRALLPGEPDPITPAGERLRAVAYEAIDLRLEHGDIANPRRIDSRRRLTGIRVVASSWLEIDESLPSAAVQTCLRAAPTTSAIHILCIRRSSSRNPRRRAVGSVAASRRDRCIQPSGIVSPLCAFASCEGGDRGCHVESRWGVSVPAGLAAAIDFGRQQHVDAAPWRQVIALPTRNTVHHVVPRAASAHLSDAGPA